MVSEEKNYQVSFFYIYTFLAFWFPFSLQNYITVLSKYMQRLGSKCHVHFSLLYVHKKKLSYHSNQTKEPNFRENTHTQKKVAKSVKANMVNISKKSQPHRAYVF